MDVDTPPSQDTYLRFVRDSKEQAGYRGKYVSNSNCPNNVTVTPHCGLELGYSLIDVDNLGGGSIDRLKGEQLCPADMTRHTKWFSDLPVYRFLLEKL